MSSSVSSKSVLHLLCLKVAVQLSSETACLPIVEKKITASVSMLYGKILCGMYHDPQLVIRPKPVSYTHLVNSADNFCCECGEAVLL